MNQAEKLAILIQTDTYLLESKKWLSHSYNICSGIGKKNHYSIEEMDAFEALSSRFARASDILIQQMLRTISLIELEPDGSVLDRINRAEKQGFIHSAQDLKNIREIRNAIVHEYQQDDIIQLFHDILEYTPTLLETIESTLAYIKKYTGERSSGF